MDAEVDLYEVITQLRDEVEALRRRVSELERQSLPPAAQGPDESVQLVIAAAVAAYLGAHAQVRQVRLAHSSAWAQVGRVGVHASHRLR